MQPDGKIVFCTPLLAGGSGLDFFITRLDSDGSFDTAFGVLGKKIVGIEGDYALATGVVLQGTQIIVGGQLTSGSQFDDFVARLEVDLLFADGFE